MAHAIAVAQRFYELANAEGQKLTNMKLQKLVVFAHGIHLAAYERPLVDEPIRAWNFGPVIPDLYEKLRKYGSSAVTEELIPSDEAHQKLAVDSNAESSIDATWKAYGHLTAWQLSELSHRNGSPWYTTWERNNDRFGVISNRDMADYYRQRIRLNNAQPA